MGDQIKRRLFSFCLLILVLAAFVSGCTDEQKENEKIQAPNNANETEFADIMTEANTAYVRALVSTSQKNVSASESSLNILADRLSYISENYGENPPEMYATDKNWKTEIKRAVLIAKYSQEKLVEGDIEAAHEVLEPMRDLFFSLHERNNVLHMGDYMTVFHASMEEAIDAANANDTETVATYIPRLGKEWQDVKNTDKPASADEGYNQSLSQVDAAIEQLNDSVNSGNSTLVQEDAESLRLSFAKVFAKYGVVIS
ncbi:MAG: hypothetical protein R2741_08230 [Methanolobus sp.]